MSRPTVYVVIFMVALNAFAGMIVGAGVDDTIGIDAHIGGDETINSVQSAANDPESGTGAGSTLFGMYHTVTQIVGRIFSILPAFNMLGRAGVPWFIIGFFTEVMGVIIGIDTVAFLRGYDL